jgi:ribonuclease HII
MKIEKDSFEKKAWRDSLYVCGVDEVGRGSLFGSVVAAAVILPLNTVNLLLKDSKEMTEKKRVEAFEWLKQKAIFSVGFVDQRQIDKKNIYQATKIAMQKAVQHVFEGLSLKVKYLVIDAVSLKLKTEIYSPRLEVYSFVKGESLSSSIAAASIVAKQVRDENMKKVGAIFPAFSIQSNKGYGSKQHLTGIKDFGLSVLHRKSFTTHLLAESCFGEKENGKQQSIF